MKVREWKGKERAKEIEEGEGRGRNICHRKEEKKKKEVKEGEKKEEERKDTCKGDEEIEGETKRKGTKRENSVKISGGWRSREDVETLSQMINIMLFFGCLRVHRNKITKTQPIKETSVNLCSKTFLRRK